MLSQKRSPDSSGTTQARIHANRLNALKSTGPKTPQGKAVVSQNALKHGLSARHDVVITENQEDFDLHRDSLLEELAPQTPMESMLTDRIISLSWRLKRADLIQNQTIDAMHEANESNPLTNLTKSFGLNVPIPSPSQLKTKNQKLKTPSLPDLTLGRLALKDFANARVLDRLLMYERRIEHSLQKTILELQRLTLIRNLTPSDQNLEPQPKQARSVSTGTPTIPKPSPTPPFSRRRNDDAQTTDHQQSTTESPKTQRILPILPPNQPTSAQNKPNPKNPKNNPTSYTPKTYANIPLPKNQKNKPKQTQFPHTGKPSTISQRSADPDLSGEAEPRSEQGPDLSGMHIGTQSATRSTLYAIRTTNPISRTAIQHPTLSVVPIHRGCTSGYDKRHDKNAERLANHAKNLYKTTELAEKTL